MKQLQMVHHYKQNVRTMLCNKIQHVVLGLGTVCMAEHEQIRKVKWNQVEGCCDSLLIVGSGRTTGKEVWSEGDTQEGGW